MELALEELPQEEPSLHLHALTSVERRRRTLVKTGRVLGKDIHRSCEFRKQQLIYYASATAQQPKGHYTLFGCVGLLAGKDLAIRVTLAGAKEVRVYASSQADRMAVLLYLRLASNGELLPALEALKSPPIPPIMPSPPQRPLSPSMRTKVVPETPVVQFQGFRSAAYLAADEEEYVPARLPPSQIAYHAPFSTTSPEVDDEIPKLNVPHSPTRAATTLQDQRAAGQKLLWNYRLEAAERHFRGLSFLDLRSALHYAEVYLFRVVLTGSRKDVQEGSAALERTEDPLLQSDEWVEVMKAEVGIFRAILLFISGQRLKAFLTLRTAWKLYRKYESQLKTCSEADIFSRISFGLGLFYLLLTLIPSSIATLLRLAGFCGDRAKGLDLLEQCSRSTGSRGPMATIVLSVFYIDMDPDLDRAERLLETCLSQYPTCVLLYWVSSIMLWKTGKVAKAISVIQKALSCCGAELARRAAFLKYELGWFYFLRLKWQDARELFQAILADCLTLSSELDGFVKDMLTVGSITSETSAAFESLYSRRFVLKQKEKTRWLDNTSTPGDRVYIPHKACLVIQLAGCYAAEQDARVVFWLKVTKIAASNPCASRTKVDEEFGTLAEIFLHRESCTLLPFELVYFLKQAAKLQPDMLALIYERATKVFKSTANAVERASACLLQIMSLCLLGETIQACGLSDQVRSRLSSVPEWALYLRPHTLYWCARAYMAQQRLEDAVEVLVEAKKMKKYVFCIKGKLARLLGDVRARM